MVTLKDAIHKLRYTGSQFNSGSEKRTKIASFCYRQEDKRFSILLFSLHLVPRKWCACFHDLLITNNIGRSRKPSEGQRVTWRHTRVYICCKGVGRIFRMRVPRDLGTLLPLPLQGNFEQRRVRKAIFSILQTHFSFMFLAFTMTSSFTISLTDWEIYAIIRVVSRCVGNTFSFFSSHLILFSAPRGATGTLWPPLAAPLC